MNEPWFLVMLDNCAVTEIIVEHIFELIEDEICQ